MPRPRVGIVDYLNSQPLAWSFLTGAYDDRYEASFHSPAEVSRLLAAGEIDIGLIPSIELQRIPGLRVIPGVCVAATHEVRSVLLISPGSISEIRSVALDENSRTSSTLVKLVLAQRGLNPRYVQHRADVGAMLEVADAALIIGDPALHVDHSKGHVLDLAAEWRSMTGLPFVFAVWAVRPGVDSDALETDFAASLEHGRREVGRIIRRASWGLDLPTGVLEKYLNRNLSFELAETERQALDEYFRRAHDAGWIDRRFPVEYIDARDLAES